MKRIIMIAVTAGMLFTVISCKEKNPLLTDFNTPFNVPPFEKIKVEHYEPAFIEAMSQQMKAVEAIVNNPEEPTFDNTIVALEYSGSLLSKVLNVFYPLTTANTGPEMQAVAQKVAPMFSRHADDINLNPELFKRIKVVYDKRNEIELNPEQLMLLTRIYDGFVRGGANLPAEKQTRFREINEALSTLELRFGDNVLAETNSYQMVLESKDDLAGLPDWLIASAAEVANNAGLEGKWVFTLHNPSWIPFLQYSERRDLREKLFKAYFMRGNNNNDNDNKEIIEQIVPLRLERANLLGYPTHAHFVLENNMAKNPETVNEFLADLWGAALKRAKSEVYDMQKMIDDEKGGFRLASWDWWFYAEKVRKAKYDLDENMLKPYFSLEGVKKGIFLLTEKLYGLQYTRLDNVPLYHSEAEVYEVKEADGSHIGLLYMDFHPRESKRGGAWMTEYRGQHVTREGEFVSPLITIVCNFTRPTGDTPALLSLDEAQTFFHEFGHALHGLLAKSTYPRLAGTNVSRDFVELPSQIMENWSTDPEFLKMYAFHYQTGEVIPDELIAKMKASGTFNQGFATTEFLAAAILDMEYHTLQSVGEVEVEAFEKGAMDKIGLIKEIIPRYRSTYFQHIFSGGYSSGYYSYIWAGQLDADAYEAFKETGDIFDAETAKRFRTLLERGGTVEPTELYRQFRGADPNPEALLRQRGLL
ncbi:MAG: M3 family metallopeptidase [Tenuifilaceae bacterium]|nr:M3 family metallopeptidase [Tenuifilaceae bacterium]